MAKRNQPTLDSVASLNADGSRNFLRPADAKGRFTTARRISAILLIAFYIAMPWIQIGGHPALFFDIIDRRFYIFGLTFAAQDFWLAFFLVSGLGFALFMITSILGRVWCGWTCPHTVFLEHVYRRIERLIEGPVREQKRLDRMSWGDPEKWVKRGLKQLAFIFVSAIITHIFISYFISIPTLYDWMTDNPMNHMAGFSFMLVTTGLLYFNFAWFREQLCLAICPYGRLQSALIDDDSIIIGYDEIRGEPRGRPRDKGVGDCIDCRQCVSVCPTGIDIRQGLQMECVGCSNCIDACNTVMDQQMKPRGLIRYDSLNSFKGKGRRILRPRVFIYTFFLLLGTAVMIYSFSNVKSAYMLVTRMTGSPYYQTETDIRNQYNVRIVNKTDEVQNYRIHIQSGEVEVAKVGADPDIEVPPVGEVIAPLIVVSPIEGFHSGFEFEVKVERNDGKLTLSRMVSFLGPDLEGLSKELVFER